MDNAKLLEISKKYAQAYAKEAANEVFIPWLKAKAAATPTPFDDVFIGALEPMIQELLEKDFMKKTVAPKVV